MTEGYIYLFAEGLYERFGKIGFTRFEVDTRMRSVQTGNPRQLMVAAFFPGLQRHEAEMHMGFAQFRMEGEWFWDYPTIQEAFLMINNWIEEALGENEYPGRDAEAREMVITENLVGMAVEEALTQKDLYRPNMPSEPDFSFMRPLFRTR